MSATVIRRVNTRMEADTSSLKLVPREVGESVNVAEIVAGEMLEGNRLWIVDDKGTKQWAGAFKMDFEKEIINEPSLFKLYQIKKAWNFTTGVNVRICLVDSGIRETTSLTNAVKEFDSTLANNEGKALHGTYMAEIIAAFDPGNSILGLAPNVEIISHKIEAGTFSPGKLSEILKKHPDVDIFNFSLTGNNEFLHQNSTVVQDLIKLIGELKSGNKIMLASTGNNGFHNGTVFYPANFADFISVAGLSFANGSQSVWGDSNRWQGVRIVTPADSYFEDNRNEYEDFNVGTSVSCAFMTGITALLISLWKKNGIKDFSRQIELFIDTLPLLQDESLSFKQLTPDSLLNYIQPSNVYEKDINCLRLHRFLHAVLFIRILSTCN